MAELNEITKGADKDPNSKPYYISTTALQIAERTMQQFIKKKKNRNTIFLHKRSNLFYRINLL